MWPGLPLNFVSYLTQTIFPAFWIVFKRNGLQPKVLDEKPCIDIPVPSSYGTVMYIILVKYKHKSNWYWIKIASTTASFTECILCR